MSDVQRVFASEGFHFHVFDVNAPDTLKVGKKLSPRAPIILYPDSVEDSEVLDLQIVLFKRVDDAERQFTFFEQAAEKFPPAARKARRGVRIRNVIVVYSRTGPASKRADRAVRALEREGGPLDW